MQRGWDGDSTWLSKEMINKGRRWYSLCDILGTCGILEGIERMKKRLQSERGRAEGSLLWFILLSFRACVSENKISSVDHITLHPLQISTSPHPTPPWPAMENTAHLSSTEYSLEACVSSFFRSLCTSSPWPRLPQNTDFHPFQWKLCVVLMSSSKQAKLQDTTEADMQVITWGVFFYEY